jgi:hypothetical protein
MELSHIRGPARRHKAANRWAKSHTSRALLPLVPSDWIEPDHFDPIDYGVDSRLRIYTHTTQIYHFHVVLLLSSSYTSAHSKVDRHRIASLSAFPVPGGAFHPGNCNVFVTFLAGMSKGLAAVGVTRIRSRKMWVITIVPDRRPNYTVMLSGALQLSASGFPCACYMGWLAGK